MVVSDAQREVCRSKKVYPTRKKAWMASLGFFKTRGNYNSPYKCAACKKFHLTHHHHDPSDEFVKHFNSWFGSPVL